MTRTKRWSSAVVAGLTATAIVITATTPALAEPDPTGADRFYTPPAPLPTGRPGDIIRAEPVVAAGPARATRIMYRSTDTHGAPIAVTGTLLQPPAPWPGPGPRPLVSFAEGTQGQGDQCAPSKTLTQPIGYRPVSDIPLGYEVPFIDALLAQGYAVVVTDYQGLGTPGTHTYAQPLPEAHAVIDAARAAQRLPHTDIPAHGPVAFYGYSQGGQAVAAAAEQASTYAPDLDVVGTFSGAPPVDMYQQLRFVDNTLAAGAIGYYVNGLTNSYPQAAEMINSAMNAEGKAMLAAVAHQCLAETALDFGLRPSNRYTASGRSIADTLDTNPITRNILRRHTLGRHPPSAPVLLSTGGNDDIVDPAGVRRLARDWCTRGATVQLAESPLPTVAPGAGIGHILNYPVALAPGLPWLRDRFARRPAPNNCR